MSLGIVNKKLRKKERKKEQKYSTRKKIKSRFHSVESDYRLPPTYDKYSYNSSNNQNIQDRSKSKSSLSLNHSKTEWDQSSKLLVSPKQSSINETYNFQNSKHFQPNHNKNKKKWKARSKSRKHKHRKHRKEELETSTSSLHEHINHKTPSRLKFILQEDESKIVHNENYNEYEEEEEELGPRGIYIVYSLRYLLP